MPTVPKEKLTPTERRELTLRALGGESVTALAREYEVSRAWIYVLLEEIRGQRREKLREVEEEAAFLRRAGEIIEGRELRAEKGER